MMPFGRFLRIALVYILAMGLLTPSIVSAGTPPSQSVIKFACVAPEGSLFVNLARDWDRELRERSGGRARLQLFPGGILGEEVDIIRKMRAGQIHATGVTGIGVGEMLPAARVIELPRLFHGYEELEAVLTQLESYFEEAFAQRGYTLMGFTEVGPIYIFSQKPVRGYDDLKSSKVWVWERDPISVELFRAFKASAVPLSLLNVLASLQTGVIDSVYGSPLAIVTMQWYNYLKYMNVVPLGYAMGAIVMDKRAFDALPPDIQVLQRELGRKYTRQISLRSRQDNARALEIMKQKGLEIVAPDDEEREQIDAKMPEVWDHFKGQLYTPELFAQIRTILAGLRRAEQTGDP